MYILPEDAIHSLERDTVSILLDEERRKNNVLGTRGIIIISQVKIPTFKQLNRFLDIS